jgi:hypothetical protein
MDYLCISDVGEEISYQFQLNFFNPDISRIIKTSLDVDPEYSKQINREISITQDGNITFKYSTKAINLKPMKKSINSMFENLSLVLQTIQQFSP